jgi:hypothetical protein
MSMESDAALIAVCIICCSDEIGANHKREIIVVFPFLASAECWTDGH